MILAYHGRHVPMEDIRRITGVSRDCLNAADMVRAGRHYSLECSAYSREPDDLRCMTFPFVAHLSFIHFVVVEGMTADRVLVNDPACGRSEIPLEQFNESFTGIVITFRPGPDFAPGGQNDRLFRNLWRRIDAGTKGRFALAFIAACVAPTILVSLADVLGGAVKGITDGSELAVSAIAAMIGLLLMHTAFSLGPALLFESAYWRMSTRHTGTFLRTLITRPFAYLSYRLPNEQVKSVYDADRIARLLCRDVIPAMLSLPAIAILVAALCFQDRVIGGTAAALTLLNLVGQSAFAHWRADETRKAAQGTDEDFRAVHGGLSGIENDKVAGMDRDYVAGNMGKQAAAAMHEQGDAIARIIGIAVARVLEYAVVFGTALMAGGLFIAGALDIADVVTTVLLSAALVHAMRDWPQLRGKCDALYLALLRQDDLDSTTSGEEDPLLTAPAVHTSPLCFDKVVFGHSPTRPPLLNGVDFAFQSDAEQVGITGPSGGGKSTFASVAAGLYAPWSGTVEAGHRVMWIDKTPFLFEGTVRDNLLLWRTEVNDATLTCALEDACLDDVIAQRPDGLDTLVLERGRNFSGGQRQRLEIARALTFEPGVLVLDEALDALNPSLEEKLRANLRARDCALIVVSHRASTLGACDRVLHFDNGRLLQSPPNDDMAATRPMPMRIETVSDVTTNSTDETGALNTPPLRVPDHFTRMVRFQQKKHWRQAHLALLAHWRGTDETAHLVPAPAGYRIEGDAKAVSQEDFDEAFLCKYQDTDLSVRAPDVLFRAWSRIAAADLTRTIVLTAALCGAILALAFITSLPFSIGDTPPTWKLWSSLGGCLLIIGLLEGARQLSALRAEGRVRVAACSDLFQRLISIRPGFFHTTPPPDLARALAGWYRLQKLLQRRKMAEASDVVIMTLGCLALGWIGVGLGLAGAALARLCVATYWVVYSAAVAAERIRDNRRLTGRRFLLDMMQGIARLRVAGGAVRAVMYWQDMFNQELEFSVRLERLKALQRATNDLWLWAAMGTVGLMAGLSNAGTDNAWRSVAALLLAWPVFSSACRVGEALAHARHACGTLPFLRRLLAARIEPAGMPVARHAEIEFDSVTFRYDGSKATALEDVSFKIAPGEFVAVVGPSGSGKSTLLRLLLNFEIPSHGRLMLGGHDVEGIDIAAWRRGVGLVQQDGHIESASTIRSIISGLAEVDLDNVWHAADQALLGDDIRAMPMGMQTIVEHGKLSTGQEQRLLIAQQLLRQPNLLILDEATNAIPEEMQVQLFRNLRRAGIGCFLATHRESAIAVADRVLVMDGGRRVWDGPPAAFAEVRDMVDMVRRERLVENEA